MITEAHDDMEKSHWMASLRVTFSAWKELLWVPMRACHSWTENYETGTAVLDSTLNRTICEDLEVRWEVEARDRNERSLCWDGDIILSTDLMIVGMGGGMSHGDGTLLT